MPSFQDSIFLFILALLLFGPKRLPLLARELGKWIGEFRRASNEFKMQMEEEMRQVEQEERLKKLEAVEAAAPKAAEPVAAATEPAAVAEETTVGVASEEPASEASAEVLPIAEAGELKIMPPATGLPTPRTNGHKAAEVSEPAPGDAFEGMTDPVPAAGHGENEAAEIVHGD